MFKRCLSVAFFLITSFTMICGQNEIVLFEVNMSYQVELGNFNPAVDNVDIAGTFNDWGTDHKGLQDSDGDLIYSVQLNGFIAGETIEYKFRLNGMWDGTEEFPGTGNNRSYDVLDGENNILVWYNNEASPNGPPIADAYISEQSIYENGVITFADVSAGNVDWHEWIFEGGSPSSSTGTLEQVQYHTKGSYDVTLIVGNSTSSDTLLMPDVITVSPRDIGQLDWWNDAVFYEIFVRSFYDSDGNGIGDFNGIIEKLDYLNDGDPETTDDLGITGIWLMPINPSPSYHGYDVTNYRAINPQYGSMNDFQRFLDEAHARGIRVIMDLVLNHSSSQHPWFQNSRSDDSAEKRDWYRWLPFEPDQDGPWGQEVWHNYNNDYYYGLFWGGMPDLNYEEPAVREEMLDIAQFWLEDVGIDGFRLDAAKYLYEDGAQLENTDETYAFWQTFTQEVKSANPDAFSVGEVWTTTRQILPYVEQDRLDYCFEFDLAGSILNGVRDENANQLLFQIQKVYNVYPHLQFGTFLTNHDQNRLMNEMSNNESLVKLAASVYLTLPGIPYLYYGEEVGMNGQKPDEQIRTPMQWSNTANAGFTTGNPWISPNANYGTYNVLTESGDAESMLNRYRKLIHIRNADAALSSGNYIPVARNEEAVLSFIRQKGDSKVLVLINLDDASVNGIDLDLSLSDIESGDLIFEDLMEGNEVSLTISADKHITSLSLLGHAVRILKLKNSTSTNPEKTNLQAFKIFPNPVTKECSIISASDELPEGKVFLYNAHGRLVNTWEVTSGLSLFKVDVSNYARGTYFLRMESREGVNTQMVIIQ